MENETSEPIESVEPEPVEPKPVEPIRPRPTKKKSGSGVWVSLLIVIAAVGLGGLFYRRQARRVAPPTPQPTPASTKGGLPATMSYTMYVPDDNALLSRMVVTEKNPFPRPPTWEMKAGHTLELLCKKLILLPRALKVLSSPKRGKDGVVTVNFSDEFNVLKEAHETSVALILDSMASTLGAVDDPDGKPVPMRVLIEGKPVGIFSEYDLSEPWKSSQPADETPPDAESVH
jgi:hypothetical protein